MDIYSIYFSSQSVGIKQSTEAFYRVPITHANCTSFSTQNCFWNQAFICWNKESAVKEIDYPRAWPNWEIRYGSLFWVAWFIEGKKQQKKSKLLSRQMTVKTVMMKSVARSAVISRMRASSIARVAEKCCGDRRGIIAGALINTCALLALRVWRLQRGGSWKCRLWFGF